MNSQTIASDINLKDALKDLDISLSPKNSLPIFENNGEAFFHSFINYSEAGVFIYDLELEMIIWANERLLSSFEINPSDLYLDNFNQILLSRIHEEDQHYMKEVGFSRIKNKELPHSSKILRVRQKDGTCKFFHFRLIIPESKEHIKIGIQTDVTPIIETYGHNEPVDIERKGSESDDFIRLKSLSKREKQILKLIVQGNTDKEIARELNISFYTVETHRKNIIQKLHVKNTACLSFLAGKCGIF